MAWAMGPGGFEQLPKFRVACQRLDFDSAAAECKISEAGIGGSLINRNEANFTLFSNAAFIIANEPEGAFLREILYYP
jgi:hypothetical protein